MKCPNCKKELDKVKVYSEIWQYAYLKNGKIAEYEPYDTENILGEEVGIECPECCMALPFLEYMN